MRADAQSAGGQRTYSAANILDFPTLLRIIHHWRWLVLGAVALGLVARNPATLLTTPVYRAVGDARSQSADGRGQRRAIARARQRHDVRFDFVATQVGLLDEPSVAERTAQELNLANNPEVVAARPSTHRSGSSGDRGVASGLKVIPPEDGQLIKFSFNSTSPQLAAKVANGVAESFINTALQRRYEASAYARNFLERQINKTRGDLERSERSLVAYAQQQGIISTVERRRRQAGRWRPARFRANR